MIEFKDRSREMGINLNPPPVQLLHEYHFILSLPVSLCFDLFQTVFILLGGSFPGDAPVFGASEVACL